MLNFFARALSIDHRRTSSRPCVVVRRYITCRSTTWSIINKFSTIMYRIACNLVWWLHLNIRIDSKFSEANRDDADSIESSVDQAKHLGLGESSKSIKIWISRFTQDPGELDMPKFGMFESRKEIRLDSSRVKRKLLVLRPATNSARLRHVSTCLLLALKKPTHPIPNIRSVLADH